MEAATQAIAGGRDVRPREAPGAEVLPVPPTDAERDAYFVRHAWLVMILSILAFVGLVVSSLHFALGSSSVMPYLIAVAFTGSYFVVALSVSAFTRSACKDTHFARVESYDGPWRSVDVLLPICGEPIEILRNTWHYVSQLHYDGPLEVYVLDDRPCAEHRAMAESYGFHYLTRPNPGWFKKAGNLKYGYEHSNGELVAILDADFCPRRDYLQNIVPYFEDSKLGIVQTPQFFRVSPDQSWLQRGAGAVQEFFYRFIQTSRDHHDGAICVGTCAIYRREALDANGGTTLIEHSEDVHTGFDLRALGWSLRYVPINLATGICPNEVEAFFRQQYRWCAGSMSLLRSKKFWKTPMPILTRCCYMSGFFYYTYTGLWTFIGPMIPLILLLAFPEKVHLANYIILLPALIYDYVIFPLWHRSRYRLEVWSVRRIFGWAHAFAIADTLRGRPMGWTPTGAQAGSGKQVRVWKDLYLFWGGLTISVWLGAALYRGATMGWVDFLPMFLLGVIYAIAILRVYQPTGGTGEMIAPRPALSPAGAGVKLLALTLAVAVLGIGVSQIDAQPTSAEAKAAPVKKQPKAHVNLAMTGTKDIYTQLQAEGVPFNTYASFIGWWPGKSPKWFLDESAALGATPFISWEPGDIPLSAIVNGSWDNYLVLWAQTIRDRAVPVYVRMAHEMNGIWYSWSQEGPAMYKAAWRHVWNVFQAVGAKNARFVWSPDGLIGKPQNEWERNVVKWYPGRRYVKYIGMSTVEFQSSVQWGLPHYFERLDFLRERYKKPMVLAEMKVVDTDRYNWLKGLRGYLDERPWFKVLVWSETPSAAQAAGQFNTGNMNWSLLHDPLARTLLTMAVR